MLLEAIMAINYDKLYVELNKREMKESQLRREAGFSANILTRIRRNQYISLESIEQICKVLDCKVDDIIDFD